MHAHMLQLGRDNGLSCTFFGYNSLEILHSKAWAAGPRAVHRNHTNTGIRVIYTGNRTVPTVPET